jgi:4-hydroxythreonine-4-phosphate dehydrogenase
MTPLPRLAMTMGDPAGVGPELCCRVAADPSVQASCVPIVIGSRALLQRVAEQLALACPSVEEPPGLELDAAAVEPGRLSAACGLAALAAIEHAVAGCRDGRFDGMVTAPINKQAITAAGCPFPGHTELLAERCGGQAMMLLYDAALAVALVTVHRSLRSVPDAISSAKIELVGQLLVAALRQIRGREPRLAVLGLNPHAGEGGLFGHEDQDLVAPAVAALRAAGIDAEGPLPPDTAFTAAARERYDGHICCYHDQGLIPFKALAFDHGVNVTLGLPIVRTSPDHGTAFDLAWTGTASASSMLAATLLAAQLASDPSRGRHSPR